MRLIHTRERPIEKILRNVQVNRLSRTREIVGIVLRKSGLRKMHLKLRVKSFVRLDPVEPV